MPFYRYNAPLVEEHDAVGRCQSASQRQRSPDQPRDASPSVGRHRELSWGCSESEARRDALPSR